MTRMKNLITGGAGFIGTHLAEKLLAQGEEVYVIDDLSTGRVENLDNLKKDPKFHYTIDSVMNVQLLAELVDRCDMIYHLAAAVGVKLIVESPVKTIETNIRGTEIILSLAVKKKKRVLLTSTSEVYGKSDAVPFKEDMDMVLGPTTHGRWSYACSKAIDEFLGLAYYHEKKLPVTVVRLFNTVGPRQTGRYGMVIPTFVKQALTGEPITIYGNGKQTRSFTYVKDVVNGLVGLAECHESAGEVFNLGHGKEISIEDLARLIKEKTSSNSEIQFIPYDQAYEKGFEDMMRRVPDITKARKLVGYSPTKDIGEILEKVIDFFKNE